MISLLNNFLKKSSLITRRIILINIDIAIVLISNYILNNHSIKLTESIQSVIILILILVLGLFNIILSYFVSTNLKPCVLETLLIEQLSVSKKKKNRIIFFI